MELNRILSELQRGLVNLYGDRLVDILLYGSYSRGEEREDSDIDIAVILKGEINPFKEIDRITELSYDLSLKYSTLLSIHPISEQDFLSRKSPFILNLREEGISI
ncbi:MAG: nucleotidyltransferase domain-containing protein [Candidatus Lokiarchaeota archaeon]|nr:nucleotidyltransferase domain-containing protein [Candidatus Lokiarchaeota archaeon]